MYMKLKIIRISPVRARTNLLSLLDNSIKELYEGSVVAITSKIISIADGDTVPIDGKTKNDFVAQQADYYLPAEVSQYNIFITITDNVLIANAGIDESNGDNMFIFWPKNPQKTANLIRKHLKDKFGLERVGVVITDSKITPLRVGTTGLAIGYSGFKPTHSYIGEPDLFGKPMRMTRASIVDGLAAAAVLVMGEGSESTPIAVIDDIDFVEFTSEDPSETEVAELTIDKSDDLYAPLFESVEWKKGQP
jgi:putative folate metabolism gamma-glutamate ligase